MVHGNFHVPCNIGTMSEILYPKVNGIFHLSCNIETNIIFKKMLLPKGSTEIPMYPITLRLIQKFFTERVQGNFLASCTIETNSRIFLLKGFMEISMNPVALRLILFKNVFS